MNMKCSGMTLIEVLLATVVLAICIGGLMLGLFMSVEIFRASQFVSETSNVLALCEAEYPMIINNDPVSDLEVSADSSIVDGWTFERSVEEDEDEDGLYLVRTKLTKGRGGSGMEQEFVRYVFYAN